MWISLIVPGMVNREDVADGAMPGVSPQRPIRAPKPGCEGQGLTNELFYWRLLATGRKASYYAEKSGEQCNATSHFVLVAN